MNEVLREMLYDILEIQEDKLAKARDEFLNAEAMTRILKIAYENYQVRVDALKEALGVGSTGVSSNDSQLSEGV